MKYSNFIKLALAAATIFFLVQCSGGQYENSAPEDKERSIESQTIREDLVEPEAAPAKIIAVEEAQPEVPAADAFQDAIETDSLKEEPLDALKKNEASKKRTKARFGTSGLIDGEGAGSSSEKEIGTTTSDEDLADPETSDENRGGTVITTNN